MTTDTGLGDFSMLDIFRTEVETHCETLTSGLLELEQQRADTARFDVLMRAAHSIKGAARIVGVEPAVRVAHAMEDCFVAAQGDRLTLNPGSIDILLRGVDALVRIAQEAKDGSPAEISGREEMESLVADIAAILTPKPAAAVPVEKEASLPGPAPDPHRATLRLSPVLDAAAAEALRQNTLTALGKDGAAIRLDFSAVTDVHPAGLALLAALSEHCERLGRERIEVAHVRSDCAALFQATGLDAGYTLAIDALPTPGERRA